MKIIINSEEELIKVAEELIHVIANLRKFTRLWEESYGVQLRQYKKHYEKKADALIERLKVEDHKQPYEVKIKIENE